MTAQLKTCSMCHKPQELSVFARNAKLSMGVSNWCRPCSQVYQQKWRSENKDLVARYSRTFRMKDVDAARERDRANYYQNQQARIEKSARWNKANKERRAEAEKARREKPAHRLHGRISAGVRSCIKRGKGGATTEQLVGYSMTELRTHLERQFVRGMSWGNMGDWHIDHIVPLSSFTITGPDDPELRRAWSLPNLRPLWAADNIAKSDKRVSLL